MLTFHPSASRFDSGAGRPPEWIPSPTIAPTDKTEAASVEGAQPMSAVAAAATSPSAPLVVTCVALGDEQLETQSLLDSLAKRLAPVLTREATGVGVSPTLSPPSLSPLHADLQDRLKRQREVNRRLRSILARLVT
ncbi:hypothetical protein [Lysobacter sp. CA196]|uniref:hypothetical protein n=1 Tax=Lysobacter sp. CA196 TaxID=3455606 RepID=UPI003F8D6161